MKKVLLIEDDVTVRENTAELLELSNYDVITASNGRLGVEKAKLNLPDIIVCDIMMPEMDGYGVLQELAKNPETANIPFIFLSAKTEHKDIRKGMDLGADDYLTKPFEEEDLLSAIESRLAKVAILNAREEKQPAVKDTSLGSLDDLRSMLSEYELQKFKSGSTIYEAGKQSNFFYLVKRGVVKAHRIDRQGKELITELYKEDDFFGNTAFNSNSAAYEEYATAMEDSELYTVSKEELHKILANNGRVTLELVEILSNNLKGVKQQLMDMAYGSVRKKTANTILLFAEKIKKHPLKSIRISRADLAGVAGMAPESLIRTLSDFKKEGLIEIEGRNIKLMDPDALKSIS